MGSEHGPLEPHLLLCCDWWLLACYRFRRWCGFPWHGEEGVVRMVFAECNPWRSAWVPLGRRWYYCRAECWARYEIVSPSRSCGKLFLDAGEALLALEHLRARSGC